jgi:hypothetical protein
MNDVLFVATVLLASTAVGIPFSLLLPAGQFKARLLAAPPIGFGLLAVGLHLLYAHGVDPRTAAIALVAVGSLLTLIMSLRLRDDRQSLIPPHGRHFGLIAAAVVLVCLLPAWIGGAQFSIFQGNPHDQISYLASAVSYHVRTHQELLTANGGVGSELIFSRGRALLSARPAVPMVLSALAVFHASFVASVYSYLVALQILVLFSFYFVLLNVFQTSRAAMIVCAVALTIGPFQQYVLDINAWSHLAGQPIYVLLTGMIVFAIGTRRFGLQSLELAKLAVLIGALLASAMYVYPEGMAVYGAGWAAIVAVAFLRPSRLRLLTALAAGCGGIAALGIAALSWKGTLGFFFGQVAVSPTLPVAWARYFHRHLTGREGDWANVIWFSEASNWHDLLYAWFSLPVEFFATSFGLYYLLPRPGLPLWLAVGVKLGLYIALIALVLSVVRMIASVLRREADSERALFLVGCLATLALPIGLLVTRNYWPAGKAFYIAVPLLFVLLALPVLMGRMRPRAIVAVSAAVIATHLLVGVARPIFASERFGQGLVGFPTAAAIMNVRKKGLDWRVDRWVDGLRACRHVMVDVDVFPLDAMLELTLTEMGVRWSQSHSQNYWFGGPIAVKSEDWANADCVVTSKGGPASGRTVLSVRK